jgi:hypothetical protein
MTSLQAVRAGVLALLVAAGCMPAAPQRCHRYDAVALTRENGFAASFDWKSERAIDKPPERVDVALTVVRPMRGPVEVVHVIGGIEADRWVLSVPDQNNVATTVCWVTPPAAAATCGAQLQAMPYFPGGYYYLRPNANVVLEAGLAFYVCD